MPEKRKGQCKRKPNKSEERKKGKNARFHDVPYPGDSKKNHIFWTLTSSIFIAVMNNNVREPRSGRMERD